MPSIKVIREEAEHRIKQLEKEMHVEHEYKEYAIANSIDDFAKDIHKNRRNFTPKDKLERLGQMMKEHEYARSYHEKKTNEIKDKKQKVYQDAREKIELLRADIRSELKLERDHKASVEKALKHQKSTTKSLKELLAEHKKRERDLEDFDHVKAESIRNISSKKLRVEKEFSALPPPFRLISIAPAPIFSIAPAPIFSVVPAAPTSSTTTLTSNVPNMM